MLCILFHLIGLGIFMSYFLAFVFILLLCDFNVLCTVWHVSGASRLLSFVNKLNYDVVLLAVFKMVEYDFQKYRVLFNIV